MTTENVKKPNKAGAVITYIIALLVIIGTWFIPLLGTAATPVVDRMTFWYLPDIFNKAIGVNLLPESIVTHSIFAFDDVPLKIFGLSINILSILYLALAVITVVALFMLIPVLAGKKEKRTSMVCAYVVEVLAAVVIAAFLLISVFHIGLYPSVDNALSTVRNHKHIVLVGAALMLILCIQSMIDKKGLGVLKTFMLFFSAVALLSLFDFVAVIAYTLGNNNITTSVNDLLVNINSGTFFASLFVSPVQAFSTAMYYLTDPSKFIDAMTSASVGTGDKVLIASICAVVVLVILNFFLDLIGLATGRKYKNNVESPRTGAKVFSFIRYLLVLAAAATVIITLLVLKWDIGAYLYLLTLVTLIQVIISIVRLCRIKSLKKKAKDKKESEIKFDDSELTSERTEVTSIVSENAEEETADEEVAEEPVAEEEAQPVEEVVEEEPVAEEVEETEAVETEEEAQPVEEVEEEPEDTVPTIRTVAEEIVEEDEQLTIPGTSATTDSAAQAPTRRIIYNVQTVYSGPTDAFMDTLTNDEKVEFTKVFITKKKGDLPAELPEYEIGGNNDDFFPVIFIYLGKFRNMISRELLGKIYKQLNKKN